MRQPTKRQRGPEGVLGRCEAALSTSSTSQQAYDSSGSTSATKPAPEPVGEARAQKFLASPTRAQRVLDGGQHVVVVVLVLLDNQIITPETFTALLLKAGRQHDADSAGGGADAGAGGRKSWSG